MQARLGSALGSLVATFALVVAVLALPAPAASAAGPAQEYASAAFKATNKVRARRDLDRLSRDRCLRRAAVRQARTMAGQENIFHQLLGPLLDGCLLSHVGENVAYGYPTGRTVVRKGWMKSPGHRANILARQWTEMGIAARRADDGTWYVAQVFGTPAG
ncbi:CAP domain-containing protein [Nocardioides sp. SYSU DS0663]|uniref:CAP domain-containing protein n=1 Tax=Nocardioides sp. SYSU DS0663 TaxID=3416445 RepID=UPI003F4B2DCC